MESQNKLLKRCEDNFNEEMQEFSNKVPEEILDCIIDVMQKGGPDFEDECNNDFVNQFIHEFIRDTVYNSKYGIILRIYLMDIFDEYLAGFKQDLFD